MLTLTDDRLVHNGARHREVQRQAVKDLVYKLRLIDWHTKESLGIPEESNGIITILMQPGSTVHKSTTSRRRSGGKAQPLHAKR